MKNVLFNTREGFGRHKVFNRKDPPTPARANSSFHRGFRGVQSAMYSIYFARNSSFIYLLCGSIN